MAASQGNFLAVLRKKCRLQRSLQLFLFIALLFFLGGAGCHAKKLPVVEDAEHVTIYVVGHGWHTGLVVPLEALSPEQLPVSEQYHNATFLEVSWGDRDFFQSEKFSLPIALKAALLPTASVLHVVGFRSPVAAYFPESTIVKLTPANTDFLKLVAFMRNSFLYDQQGKAQDLGPGLYGDSHFYRAHEKYFLPKTCNTWTAKALRRAGYAISSFKAVRAESLVNAVKRYGRQIRLSSPSN